ncbi:MAG TPA: di-heme oxidoredictase family protein [Acidobacteriota bacterium]|nr:di-heme oxidoredictase family protein [Acidobacteriota bacterium]
MKPRRYAPILFGLLLAGLWAEASRSGAPTPILVAGPSLEKAGGPGSAGSALGPAPKGEGAGGSGSSSENLIVRAHTPQFGSSGRRFQGKSLRAKPATAGRQGRPSQPGNPLPGITADEFELFRIGLDDFLEVEDAGEGLGPAFNGLGCAQCHSVPAIGGISPVAGTRAGRIEEDGTFTVLGGDTLYHLFALPNQECQPRIPPEANVVARRVPIPLFGAGLVEAIPDSTLLALEDPEDLDGDGISGRAARVIDVASGQARVGRFGWKAQHATLLAFSGDAYRNEMGITNDLFRTEAGAGIDPETLALCDLVPDPEDSVEPLTGLRGIDAFEAFMRFLAPIDRGPVGGLEARGAMVFREVGCHKCHAPVLMTGASSNPVFDRRPVRLYSDLLLHDVGTGDGIEQADAAMNEIRTPALWGLRFRRPLLHDGSAATPAQAIERHANEAAGVIELYKLLSEQERLALLNFLDSL